ncbi:MAG TPA: protein kinase [Dehalococcoidia bacterium]|nr:protein kinase [Dehalococcoidia bacterium]
MSQPSGTAFDRQRPDRIGPGMRLSDRYDVQEPVGYGGMSSVYHGIDRLLDRDVAIKVLNTRIGGNDAERAAFLREARAAASLTHSGIVGVYDAGIYQGWPYIVMEYVPGGSLKQVIDTQAPLPPARAAALAAEVADALQYGHDRGVIHCDVKPQNVLIDARGHTKLVDFGISQSLAATAALTSSVSGTAGYVAPEQLEGVPLDGRADIYSLGTVLYELLSGRLPFEAPNLAALATRRLVSEPRPLRELNPNLPPALTATVMRCLARDRAGRCRSAGELAAALREAGTAGPERFSVDGPSLAPPREPTQVWRREDLTAAPRPRSGAFWLLLAILLALLVALIVSLAVVLSSRTSAGGTAAVPSVQHERLDRATSDLHAAGLTVSVTMTSSQEPFGTVIGQDPPAGTALSKGGAVSLSVSRGP